MNEDEKLVTARAEDLFTLCDRYGSPVFSGCLDGAEQAVIHDNVSFPYGYNVLFWGGFDDAEKKIMGVFPEWTEPDISAFPLRCFKVEGGYSRRLDHRDYMGTILSLGISQARLGDIVVYDGYAYVFVHEDIADYVKDNLIKIGNQGVTVTELEDYSSVKIERRYKTIGTVCASERLDAVVGAAANISRAQSAALINAGRVKVNHREVTKTSETVREGDILSIRGSGRFLVYSFDGETRKNRMHITLKQYI